VRIGERCAAVRCSDDQLASELASHLGQADGYDETQPEFHAIRLLPVYGPEPLSQDIRDRSLLTLSDVQGRPVLRERGSEAIPRVVKWIESHRSAVEAPNGSWWDLRLIRRDSSAIVLPHGLIAATSGVQKRLQSDGWIIEDAAFTCIDGHANIRDRGSDVIPLSGIVVPSHVAEIDSDARRFLWLTGFIGTDDPETRRRAVPSLQAMLKVPMSPADSTKMAVVVAAVEELA